jgi:predicted alpha/beta superfamily hydrolase
MSESAQKRREYFPAVETHLVRSKYVAQTFKIQVMRPLQKKGEVRGFPVVYVTDGNAVFDMFKSISWLMQSFKPESSPFILIAIGYPGDAPVAGELLRGRDLTFPGCPDFFSGLQLLRDLEGVLAPEEGAKYFCGAADLQRFISEELIPFIDEKYETLHGDRTYFGHSMGGGFGLFTLFTQTHMFRSYVLSSATVNYHGEAPSGTCYVNHDFMLQRARDFIASGKALHGIKLYMSVGTEEEFEPLIANWQFTSSFYRITALLKAAAIPGLKLTTEVFQGETHMSAWPIAFIHGMRAMFGVAINS